MKESKEKQIYALYLPQFHRTPDNDRWWKEGYTEWDAVRDARSYFKGHYQPNVPKNGNYYDLSNEDASTWKWQAELAKEYGVDAFCIYHYWFKDGKQQLYRPMEILLEHKEIELQYFVCWANEPWRKTWYSGNSEILLEQEYGGEDEWIKHFNYLKMFFGDERYLKFDNRPVIAIYKTIDIDELEKMRKLWDDMAQEMGFDGVYIMGAKTASEQEVRKNLVDAEYMFEPGFTLHYQYSFIDIIRRGVPRVLRKLNNILCKTKTLEQQENMKIMYKNISLPTTVAVDGCAYGICPAWDNTPRKQEKGCVFTNASPSLFEQKLRELYYAKDGMGFIMINAWNEWGEGAYLEPDERNGYKYLDAIRRVKRQEK